MSDVDRRCAWTTWAEVDRILSDGAAGSEGLPTSVAAAIGRGIDTARRAIAWHS